MQRTERQSVLVIENDAAVARQVQDCLTLAGFQVFGPVHAIADAPAAASAAVPDAMVVDIAMTTHGHEGWQELLARVKAPVIYLSTSIEREMLERAADAHAAAYIMKPFSDRQLVSAVALALIAAERGGTLRYGPKPLTAEEKLRLIQSVVNDAGVEGAGGAAPGRMHEPEYPDSLSVREREIVALLADGARVITIARQLHLSPHTVRNHLKSVFRKLNLHGQHELFEYWRSQGVT